MKKKSKKKFKWKIFKKFKSRYYNVVSLLFVALLSCLWLANVDKEQKKENSSELTSISSSDLLLDFLDVGSADCALIHNDKNLIMIDAGLVNSEISIPNYIEKEIFKKRNVKQIDLMVLTHPHADHYGQMEKVLDRFETKRFITSKSSVDKTDHLGYDKIIKKVKAKNIKFEYSRPKTYMDIGDIKVSILGPIYQDNEKINNNSVVLKIEYKDVKILFTGDAEKEEEKDLINSGQNLESDVIKIGHHGSSTSSSFNFLRKVNPKYAIISTRNKKSISYPHRDVANRLNALGIPYLMTQDLGTIRLVVDKNGKLHVPNQWGNAERKVA